MPPRKKPKLLAQGKPRTLGGSARPWRVRLYAPEAGGTKYQVMFRAPAGEGEPWKRVLRRANSEDEARKIFAQAEAALDTEKETPAGADVRASRTIRMLGEEYLKDSIERGKQPRTMEQASPGSTPTSCPPSATYDELPRVKELLDLPANASLQQVVNAQEAERQRRASLAAREKDRNLAWWNYPVPPEDELWLFVDSVTLNYLASLIGKPKAL